LEISVARPSRRLAAGTLVLALPLAAAAGCGTEKKRTIKAEFAAASTNLQDARAAAFTLRFNDPNGTVAKLASQDGSTPPELMTSLLKGSITYVVDPASDKRLKDLQNAAGTPGATLSEQLKDVNFAFIVRDDRSALGELRVVGGVLYAHVDLTAIGRLAAAGGVDDFDATLDEAAASGPPELGTALADVRAGKWIKLDLSKYIEQFKELADELTPGLGGGAGDTPDAAALSDLGKRLFGAVKPYVTVTDANDSSADRVLDVKVQARPALKAALKILQTTKSLPFAEALVDVDPTVIDDNVLDGPATGTITLKSGHLSQFTVDIESIRKLAKDPGKDSVAGAEVIVDIDDRADEVAVPDNVSSFDVGALLDQLLQGFSEGVGAGVSAGSFSG
jgi:hypothetical protein